MKFSYKNIGTVTKEFYGVTFKPGEVHEVEGYINAKSFIRIDKPVDDSKNSPKSNIKVSNEAKQQDPKPQVKSEDKPSDASKSTDTKPTKADKSASEPGTPK